MTAVRLRAGDYEATFRPDAGMTGTSLRYRNVEHVVRPEPLGRLRAGVMTGISLMHPWANRLGARRYRAAGRTVDLTALDLPTDAACLPLHGNLCAAPFVVDRIDRHRLDAHLGHEADSPRFAAFPYPHRLDVSVQLDARRGLTVGTVLRPTGRRAVPVAFGWHPYLRLPASTRSGWALVLPGSERLALGGHKLPTGARTPVRRGRLPLAGTSLDDHFALRAPTALAIGDGERRVTVRFGNGYGYAQVYAPARRRFVAIEPMTAPIDGLRTGTTPSVAPGEQFTAGFTIAVGAD